MLGRSALEHQCSALLSSYNTDPRHDIHARTRPSKCCMCPFAVLPSSKHSLTYLQYATHQSAPAWPYPSAGAVRSPPSHTFAHYFHNAGRPSAGVHSPSRQHYPHPDPRSHPLHHSRTHSAQYAHDRGYRHVQPAPVHMPVYHSSQPRSRVAEFHINPGLVYPSHSHSDPRYTNARPILRNRGGPPLAPAVSHRICLSSQSRTNPNSHLSTLHLAF
jgi:hypothetical protein